MTSVQDDRAGYSMRRLVNPIIKSWKTAEEKKVLSVLVDLGAAFSKAESVLVDLFVAEKAPVVEGRLRNLEVALWRHRPGQDLPHRIGRATGVYSYASGLSVIVRIGEPVQLAELLAEGVIWDADFTVYVTAGDEPASLPDPHLAFDEFSPRVAWCLAQQTGVPDWLITATTPDELDRLSNNALDVFGRYGLKVQVR